MSNYINGITDLAKVDNAATLGLSGTNNSRQMVIPALLSVRTQTPRTAAALPWYRAGGVPAPVAVYQPKGAADLAESYVNFVNPGTYNAVPGTAPTALNAAGRR